MVITREKNNSYRSSRSLVSVFVSSSFCNLSHSFCFYCCYFSSKSKCPAHGLKPKVRIELSRTFVRFEEFKAHVRLSSVAHYFPSTKILLKKGLEWLKSPVRRCILREKMFSVFLKMFFPRVYIDEKDHSCSNTPNKMRHTKEHGKLCLKMHTAGSCMFFCLRSPTCAFGKM